MFIRTITSSSSADRNTALTRRRVEFSVTQTEDLQSPQRETQPQRLGVCLAVNENVVYAQLKKFIAGINEDESLTDQHLSEMERIVAHANEIKISGKFYKTKSEAKVVLEDWTFAHERNVQDMAEKLQEESLFDLRLTVKTSGPSVKRSAAVRAIALKQADGICESCNSPAPFKSRNGFPYLEGHHVKFLSQGGSDTPENVIAICPNCHREAHFSKGVVNFTRRLELVLGRRTSI